MDARQIGGKVQVLGGEILLLRRRILHACRERARSGGQPFGTKNAAGIELETWIDGLPSSIDDFEVDALILQVAADGTGVAVEGLRGQRQIDLRVLARSDVDRSGGGEVRNSRIKGAGIAARSRLRKICRKGRGPGTGPDKNKIPARLQLCQAEFTLCVRASGARHCARSLAIFDVIEEELHRQGLDGFAVVAGNAAGEDAFGNELEDDGRLVRANGDHGRLHSRRGKLRREEKSRLLRAKGEGALWNFLKLKFAPPPGEVRALAVGDELHQSPADRRARCGSDDRAAWPMCLR